LKQSGTQTPIEEDCKPKSRIVLLPEDLQSDTESVLQLLAVDPFLPSPNKTDKEATSKKVYSDVEETASTFTPLELQISTWPDKGAGVSIHEKKGMYKYLLMKPC
jgi:hypothetical protein